MNRRQVALAGVGRLTQAQALLASVVTRRRPPRAGAPQRILVVRLDETIGDTVMCSPFLRELRRAAPGSSITLVANRGRADMYAHCPYVDELVLTEMGSAASPAILGRPWAERRFVRTHLGDEAFDVAFVPRVDYDHHAAFLAHAGRAPITVGFSERATERKQITNRGVDRLFTDVRTAVPHTHEIDRQLGLLDVLPIGTSGDLDRHTEVWIGDDDVAAVDQIIAERALGDYVVLAPTGGHSDLKQWPIERYSEAAARLLDAGRTVVVIGAPSDARLFDQLDPAVKARAVDMIGQLSVMRSAALIARSAGFVGADSGMTHVAGAVGVPTVAVFGPTCTHTFSPAGPQAAVISLELACGPCARGLAIDRCATCIFEHPLCMSGVSASAALDTLAALGADQRFGTP